MVDVAMLLVGIIIAEDEAQLAVTTPAGAAAAGLALVVLSRVRSRVVRASMSRQLFVASAASGSWLLVCCRSRRVHVPVCSVWV